MGQVDKKGILALGLYKLHGLRCEPVCQIFALWRLQRFRTGQLLAVVVGWKIRARSSGTTSGDVDVKTLALRVAGRFFSQVPLPGKEGRIALLL